MVYISKMVDIKGKFYAFGRVFSGTVKSGSPVRIMGCNFKAGEKTDLAIKNIQSVCIMMGNKIEGASEIPCGSTVALAGIDKHIMKQATISDHPEAHTIKMMKFSVSPVVRIAIEPKNPGDKAKLVEGMKKLAQTDQLIQCYTMETGENIIAGCGELHLRMCLDDLETKYAKIPLIKANPIVSYKETVTEESSQPVLAKSPNRHNRIYTKALPLDHELINAIEENKLPTDVKLRSSVLVQDFNWDLQDTKRIWSFGPEKTGANMLVDATKQVQYLTEVKDSVDAAFQWVTKEGVMTEECMRGIRFNLSEAELHADSIHRAGGQIIPAVRRSLYGSQLTAKPRLEEPIFLVEIQLSPDDIGAVYQTLTQRRGMVVSENPVPGYPMTIVKAYLPVSESFGFTEQLRAKTSGRAFP